MSDTATDTALFERLAQTIPSQGIDVALNALADELLQAERFHELFDVRLMQARQRGGLPVIMTKMLDELPESQQLPVEQAYLEACREVGYALLQQGRVREAWIYLRPVGDRQRVAEVLEQLPAEVQEEHSEEIIELALQEGLATALGFRLLIAHMGLCQAITTYESEMYHRPRTQRQAAAAILIDRLYTDLVATLQGDIYQQQGTRPKETSVRELIRDRDWLFSESSYHLDTTHLHNVVRMALVVDDPQALQQAVELAEYGQQLHPTLHYQGDEPFADVFRDAGLFLQALLGEQVERAIAFFRQKAKSLPVENEGSAAAEALVSLLARLGRYGEAIDAVGEFLPLGAPLTGFAPSLLELAAAGQEFERLQRVALRRGDLVGYTAALVQRSQESQPQDK